jgi:AcrR family transcriptional regulator
MKKQQAIIGGAERAFEAEGFRGIGVDKILAQSGASTRTLYKHFGSRDGLVVEVLKHMHLAFMALLREADPSDPVGQLFDIQRRWTDDHINSGCMFLRAHGEYAAVNAEITAVVHDHKQQFETEIGRRVEIALGSPDADLAMQISLLFEGATALLSLRGPITLETAKEAAALLVRSRLEHRP